MDKGIIVHRLSLNMEDQRVQATITLAQGDTATHRLVVDLRNGSEIVEFKPGAHAVLCVQNASAGVDVLGDVTLYGAGSVYPNCLVCDVNPAITAAIGMHEACFVIYNAPGGAFASMNSPKIAFVVKPDLMASSDLELEGNEPYAAIVKALIAAEEASKLAVEAKALAEDEVAAIKNAAAKAESGDEAAVTLTLEEDAEGKKYVAFHFCIPRGATGEQGPRGVGFEIKKFYGTKDEMDADRANTEVESGQLVAIRSNVEDERNAEVYVKTDAGFEFFLDMSGATGLRGETGYTPEFKVQNGVLYIKRTADGEWELLGADVIALAKKVAVGTDSKAITPGSVAMGNRAVAGACAHYIEAIDKENKKIYLRTTGDVPSNRAFNGTGTTVADYDCGYAVGDEICVINNTHYAFCATITEVEGNVLTYAPYASVIGADSKTVERLALPETFATVPTYDESNQPKRALWADCILWVPTKPEAGFLITSEDGTGNLFEAAFCMGDDNFAAADDALVAGEGNVAGGNHATIFGVNNRGAYGNLIGCRENFSIGVHSTLFGRFLRNLGEYNALFNRFNTVGGIDNNVSGYGNNVTGTRNRVGGKNNVVPGSHNNVDGEQNEVYGSRHIVGGYNNDVGKTTPAGSGKCTVNGDGNSVEGTHHTVNGKGHTVSGVGNTVNGEGNTVAGSFNTVGGSGNDVKNKCNIVGGSNNTVNALYSIVSGGNDNEVTSHNSQVIGGRNKVSGNYNTVHGTDNICTHKYVTMRGAFLVSGADYQVIFGAYNVAVSGARLVIGNGSASKRSNALVIYSDGSIEIGGSKVVTESKLMTGAW